MLDWCERCVAKQLAAGGHGGSSGQGCKSWTPGLSGGQVHVGWWEHLGHSMAWMQVDQATWSSVEAQQFRGQWKPPTQGSDSKVLWEITLTVQPGLGFCSQDTFLCGLSLSVCFHSKPKVSLTRLRLEVWVAEVRVQLLIRKEPEIWFHVIFQPQMMEIGSLGSVLRRVPRPHVGSVGKNAVIY